MAKQIRHNCKLFTKDILLLNKIFKLVNENFSALLRTFYFSSVQSWFQARVLSRLFMENRFKRFTCLSVFLCGLFSPLRMYVMKKKKKNNIWMFHVLCSDIFWTTNQPVLYERGVEKVFESSLLPLVADQDTVLACLGYYLLWNVTYFNHFFF